MVSYQPEDSGNNVLFNSMNATLEAINSAAIRFLSPTSLEETYSYIVDEGLKLIEGSYGSVLLPIRGNFKRVYASVPIAYRTKVRKRAYTYRSLKERRPIVVPIDKTVSAHPELINYGIQWSLFLPMVSGETETGVLVLHSTKEDLPSNQDLNILMLFGSMASLAIEKTQLYQQTKSALELRDLFISIASHELNTPLTTMYGYAQMLNLKINPEMREHMWVKELLKETHRLKDMVKDLLTVNKIKQGDFSFSFEPVNIIDLINRVLNNFGVMYPKRIIVLENKVTSQRVSVVGDEGKLIQVFMNLLANAVKFSSDDSRIDLVIEDTKLNFLIHVKDFGIGIPEKDYKKVFQGFYKGPHEKKGMGIGLFLSKFFIEEHKGSIGLNSELGQGTEFIVKLPKLR